RGPSSLELTGDERNLRASYNVPIGRFSDGRGKQARNPHPARPKPGRSGTPDGVRRVRRAGRRRFGRAVERGSQRELRGSPAGLRGLRSAVRGGAGGAGGGGGGRGRSSLRLIWSATFWKLRAESLAGDHLRRLRRLPTAGRLRLRSGCGSDGIPFRLHSSDRGRPLCVSRGL